MDSGITQALNRALQSVDIRQGVIFMNQRTYDSVVRHLDANRNPFVPRSAEPTWGMFTLQVKDGLRDGDFQFEGVQP